LGQPAGWVGLGWIWLGWFEIFRRLVGLVGSRISDERLQEKSSLLVTSGCGFGWVLGPFFILWWMGLGWVKEMDPRTTLGWVGSKKVIYLVS